MAQDGYSGAEHRVAEEDVNVYGETVLTVLDGLQTLPDDREDACREIFDAHGLADVHSDEWYSRQPLLASLREIGYSLGDETLTRLGRRVPKTTIWPADVTSPAEALASINKAYQLNHHGKGSGVYDFRQTGDRRGTVTVTTPYPCAYEMGIVEGALHELTSLDSTDTSVEVYEVGTTCRKDGGRHCTYDVQW